ncbi:hypothetical protein FOL47_002502 [Perkinsus chesapeaki]|uniref:C3H1-type domain-containing protein n=1 Tax=Perkinsus chesapeaki TaxID=330153 RepID=A0A7J6N082_PERCH|nr:hypothetical protein FOL47_002502 [Perkinsus chesapeaki]
MSSTQLVRSITSKGEALTEGKAPASVVAGEDVEQHLPKEEATVAGGACQSEEQPKKKPLCDHFKRGKCRLENSCRFAHSLKEHNDPSLIAKRRAEAKAEQKLIRMRKREAEKSAAELTCAGESEDSLSSCSPATSPRYCSFSRSGVSPQQVPCGLPKRASTGSLPTMAVTYPGYYPPSPVYCSPVCYSPYYVANASGAYYVVQHPQWEPESPCYAATPTYYYQQQYQQQQGGATPSNVGFRRSASCGSMMPTYYHQGYSEEERYED